MNFSSVALYLVLFFTPLPQWPAFFVQGLSEAETKNYSLTFHGNEATGYLEDNNSSSSNENDEGLLISSLFYTDSQNRIKALEEDDEKFYTQMSDGKSILIVNDDSVIRIIYDDNFNIIEKSQWKNGNTLDTCFLEKKSRYQYSENKLYYVCEELLQDNIIRETFYDKDKNPIEVKTSNIDEEENKKLIDDTHRIFDNDGKLIEERIVTYIETDDDLYKGQKKIISDEKKYLYTYGENSSFPDVMYYENGILKISNEYIDNDTYVETLYFENRYSILTLYEHGRKKSEAVYLDGKELRRRIFE